MAFGFCLMDDAAATSKPPSGRILAFDGSAAMTYATIAADRRRAGRPISQFDAQIAAIAASRGAAIATRNVADFRDVGVTIVNPWDFTS